MILFSKVQVVTELDLSHPNGKLNTEIILWNILHKFIWCRVPDILFEIY